jgi:hypothetical protein
MSSPQFIKLLFVAAALLFIVNSSSWGQSNRVQQMRVSMTVGEIMDIGFSSGDNSSSSGTGGNGGGSGNKSGVNLSMGEESISEEQKLNFNTNQAFSVTLKAKSPYFTYTGDSTDPKLPIKDILFVRLKVGDDQNGEFKQVSTSPVLLTANNSGGSNTKQSYSIQYKTTPPSNLPPGRYEANIEYSATQQ